MVCFLNNNINTHNICCFKDQGCVESGLLFGAPFLFWTPVCFSGVIFSHALAVGHLLVRYRTMVGSVMYT